MIKFIYLILILIFSTLINTTRKKESIYNKARIKNSDIEKNFIDKKENIKKRSQVEKPSIILEENHIEKVRDADGVGNFVNNSYQENTFKESNPLDKNDSIDLSLPLNITEPGSNQNENYDPVAVQEIKKDEVDELGQNDFNFMETASTDNEKNIKEENDLNTNNTIIIESTNNTAINTENENYTQESDINLKDEHYTKESDINLKNELNSIVTINNFKLSYYFETLIKSTVQMHEKIKAYVPYPFDYILFLISGYSLGILMSLIFKKSKINV